jgi:hypothetical protein
MPLLFESRKMKTVCRRPGTVESRDVVYDGPDLSVAF